VDHGPLDTLSGADCERLWADIAVAAMLTCGRTLWRINVVPRQGPAVTAAIDGHGGDWVMDWGGG